MGLTLVLVKTDKNWCTHPWHSEAIPFEEAARIGTDKVIRDHSTIGIVVTTDGYG